MIGFDEKHIKVRKKDKFAYIRVTRTDGADGDIQCMCRTEVLKDISNQATEFTDFLPIEETLKFEHQETEKMVKVELFQQDAINAEEGEHSDKRLNGETEHPEEEQSHTEDVLIFQVKLDNPSPQGVKISKKNICFVEIVPDDKGMDQED